MMVKICGITRREDAEAAVEAGASALGFIFYPKSPRYVTPSVAAALGKGFDHILKVGIFVDESPAAIEAIMATAKLDVAQVYGDAIPKNTRVWKAFRPADLANPLNNQPANPLTNRPAHPLPHASEPRASASGWTLTADTEAILLDGPANGISFDWTSARDPDHKIIIAGGLDASNVADAIRIAKPWGVDASSKLESAPGVKDHQKMRAFIKAAQEAK
jgi:phosphoribosylanthranilate isomerase